MSVGEKLGDVEIPPVNAGNSGDIDGGAVTATKLGDIATGIRFGDLGIDDTKLGMTGVDATRFGEAGVIVTAAMSGDTDFLGMQGRKFGDVANESVRFETECEVISRFGNKASAFWSGAS